MKKIIFILIAIFIISFFYFQITKNRFSENEITVETSEKIVRREYGHDNEVNIIGIENIEDEYIVAFFQRDTNKFGYLQFKNYQGTYVFEFKDEFGEFDRIESSEIYVEKNLILQNDLDKNVRYYFILNNDESIKALKVYADYEYDESEEMYLGEITLEDIPQVIIVNYIIKDLRFELVEK